MWTRRELKERAKFNMHHTYWRNFLAALILTLTVAMTGGLSQAFPHMPLPGGRDAHFEFYQNGQGHDFSFEGTDPGRAMKEFTEGMDGVLRGISPVFPFVAGVLVAVLAALGIVKVLLAIFLFKPLEVGAQRFFVVNSAQPGQTEPAEIAYPFGHGYLNVVLTMFLKELYIFLWSLLLIIPGVVKSYSYRLVPYILAEEPGMDRREAFRLSRSMMDGHKWEAFILDLSFILWELLDVFTLGLLDLFYVNPYRAATNAEFYITLRDHYLGNTAA